MRVAPKNLHMEVAVCTPLGTPALPGPHRTALPLQELTVYLRRGILSGWRLVIGDAS
jgi:hypothetical protein